MALSFTEKKRIRKFFGREATAALEMPNREMPNLIRIQQASYENFLQMGAAPDGRIIDEGLEGVFRSVFPIKDYQNRAELEYVSYKFEEPKYDVQECMQRDLTYGAPLKIRLQLSVYDEGDEVDENGVRLRGAMREIKEQEVHMGDIPLMTEKGTFVVNGTERVIVSQMHRSPGVFFDHDQGKSHSSGKLLFRARIIPYRGSWLDFEFDPKDILQVRIDRKRKIPATVLLMATLEEEVKDRKEKGLRHDVVEIMLEKFYGQPIFYTLAEDDSGDWITDFRSEEWGGQKPEFDIVDAESGKLVAEKNTKVTRVKAKRIVSGGTKKIRIPSWYLHDKYLALDVVNEKKGYIYAEAGEVISVDTFEKFKFHEVKAIAVVKDVGPDSLGPWLLNTLLADKNRNNDRDEPFYTEDGRCVSRETNSARISGALDQIYKVLRPGEPPTADAASRLFKNLFFDIDRFSLSDVGRVKLNERLKLSVDGFEPAPNDFGTLRVDDIFCVAKVLLDLKDGNGEIDDIDNLGNRRVRPVGELMENNYRLGLVRMERAIKERMSSVDFDIIMPNDLINAKPVIGAVREFFGSSQLSQFMDQTNPLSEITHKRRLSALGPGGLTRERAGFEVRDVHPTHYGRICPIETPEGPNIGLINSLATHARINKYGFIESPYRVVQDGLVTNDIKWLSAVEESQYTIAQANASRDENGRLANDLVNSRSGPARDALLKPREEVDFIDVSPKQLVSVAAALIPFLENDDANRALMGSNMQRQAVPLVRSEAPLVGTGMESIVARDSLAAVVAKRSGVVEQVDATRIVIRATESLEAARSGVDIYRLAKYQRSNQNSCINQRPIVTVGDIISAGDIIADGPSTDLGELALGRNVLVAFMPWNGYNFEDSILISERIVKDDVFTSIHLEEYEVSSRDTKLGPEDITRDIPNVSEDMLSMLDETGIITVGAEVTAGDILVGKVTPKGESPTSPEDKLLRAIFGEKAADVRDTSLKVPPGGAGTVVEVRVFTRNGVDKDQRALQIENEQIHQLQEDQRDELAILERDTYTRLKSLLVGRDALTGPFGMQAGRIKVSDLDSMEREAWWEIELRSEKSQAELDSVRENYKSSKKDIEHRFENRVAKVEELDNLPPGVMKVVKVFVAVKRKLQPGDKMAGRHGNKGVISKINPVEDMPFLPDGTPVDIVLNPLGVPSRMNVGQILETHTGWAAAGLGRIVEQSIEQWQQNNNVDELRGALQTVYGEEQELPEDEEELVELAENVTHGVPIATPVFEGARESNIVDLLKKAGFDSSGQETLYDGRSGEPFHRSVTVGYKYLLKLHHLVDEKIHARSIGPYSLVTQQPLGGKAQFGGQRFGEMEVWALEAYGAAYTLQEVLTVKSDDTDGRNNVYNAIVGGNQTFDVTLPESFRVLGREIRSLGLDFYGVNYLDRGRTQRVEILKARGDKEQTPNFDGLQIKIASPEDIRRWSNGEVKKPETINYRTFKPERDGLFCARIFGPIKDYECLCGRYRRVKHKGLTCEKCHVDVTHSKVRRERMGHIELAAPVAHIWFLKSLPSRIATLLGMTLKDIERVLYFESFVVIDEGRTDLKYLQIISEQEYERTIDNYGEGEFEAGMGAEAILELLEGLNISELCKELKKELSEEGQKARPSVAKTTRLQKRLKVVEGFDKSDSEPSSMIMRVIPVLPPDLRPLVPLDGGRFATSDLNDLYRRVINRNNRLRRLMDLKAPDIIIRNEKRMLQESVDALFDNGRRGRTITGNNKRPLKSLSDMLKGKQGRFRQNLLGKRVDYSGRSVIVVGPNLKLHECGLPKKMALELFKPFVYARLDVKGITTTIKSAKKLVEKEHPEVWDVLDEVIREHPVLLNRAPTLHRLGIQAFEPKLIEGKAIQLHPLVCAAFNADFDGDQMAVHVPLSFEAQLEARVLMMSTNNILSPANGKPIIVPSQDIVLGLYHLSIVKEDEPGEGLMISDVGELEHALESGRMTLHAKIKVRFEGVDERGKKQIRVIDTTPGRFMIASLLPKEKGMRPELVNQLMTKKAISGLINEVYRACGQKATVIFCDKIMELGFREAAKAGISFGKDDMKVPPEKADRVQETRKRVEEYEKQYNDGLITKGEKYNKVVDAWSTCTEKVAEAMMKVIGADQFDQVTGRKSETNSIYMMADSGARGSKNQMKQLAGMRGLMAKPSGEIIETPITSNFKEGLNVLEYFNSTHGARKGLADTALKTANSGYLTRRLVDVAQDCVVREEDCKTDKFIRVTTVSEGADVIVPIQERILGRTIAQDIKDRGTGEVIVRTGTYMDEKIAQEIADQGINSVNVRSPLTCESARGICATCYGRDLARGEKVSIGEAVGVIAAQSIGEPGTQLTMRTFHIGGAASAGQSTVEAKVDGKVVIPSEQNYPIHAKSEGTIRFQNDRTERQPDGTLKVTDQSMLVFIVDEKGKVLESFEPIIGSVITVNESDSVKQGDLLSHGGLQTVRNPIFATVDGKVRFQNEMTERQEDGMLKIIDKSMKVSIVDSENKVLQEFEPIVGSVVTVNGGDTVKKGDKLSLGNLRVISPSLKIHVVDRDGNEIQTFKPDHHGAELTVNNGNIVKRGDKLAAWESLVKPTVSHVEGTIKLEDVIEGKTARTETDVTTLKESTAIMEWRSDTFSVSKEFEKGVDGTVRVKRRDQKDSDNSDSSIEEIQVFKNTNASSGGKIRFRSYKTRELSDGSLEVAGRSMSVLIVDVDNESKIRESYKLKQGSVILVKEGDTVKKDDRLFYDTDTPFESFKPDPVLGPPILTVADGSKVRKGSRIYRERTFNPRIEIIDKKGSVVKLLGGKPAAYQLNIGATLSVKNGETVVQGQTLAIETTKSTAGDITGGLPRVAELFEARNPKDNAVIAESSGKVEFGREYKNKRTIIVRASSGDAGQEYHVQKGKPLAVQVGDTVEKGDLLMEGSPSPQDLLSARGLGALADYLIEEVQKVYRLQGVPINDKHIEVILRQMMQKVEIVDAGTTTLVKGEQVDKYEYELANKEVKRSRKKDKSEAIGKPLLLGITKASLQTKSFISAASFQETTKILTEASIQGKIDDLDGLKENVIVGRPIPAGTGHSMIEYRKKAQKLDAKILAKREADLARANAELEAARIMALPAADTDEATEIEAAEIEAAEIDVTEIEEVVEESVV